MFKLLYLIENKIHNSAKGFIYTGFIQKIGLGLEKKHQPLPSPMKWLFTNHDDADAYLPHNLNGTPQIEDEEHNRPVVHFFQTTKNDEEDKIPSNHLIREQNP